MDEKLQAGQAVWCKIGSFPWWPAKIEDEEDLPSFVMDIKPKNEQYPVYFFGTREFGWSSRKNLKLFTEEDFSAKSKQKKFLLALEEIKDPSKWPAKGAFKDSVDPSIKPPKQVKHDEYDPEKEQLVKKKSNKRKNEVTLRDQMFTLRVKLQEFLQSDERDFSTANECLSLCEVLKLDLELFKETKLPKVVRFLSKKDIQEYSISKRCENLTVKWKQELEKGLVQKQKMPKLAVHDSVKTTAETAGGKVEEIESSAPINGEESLHPGNTEDSNQMSDSGAPVVSESGLEVEDANQLSNVDSAQDMHVSV